MRLNDTRCDNPSIATSFVDFHCSRYSIAYIGNIDVVRVFQACSNNSHNNFQRKRQRAVKVMIEYTLFCKNNFLRTLKLKFLQNNNDLRKN